MDHTHDNISDKELLHEFEHEFNIEHTHDHESEEEHEHAHKHSHHHSESEKKRQINRISRIIGHLQYVKRLIEEDADCAEVLMQLSASKSATNGLAKEIINEHISHCITHAIEEGDTNELEEFKKAIEKFM